MTHLVDVIIKDNRATSDDGSDDLHAHQNTSNYGDFGGNLIGVVDPLIIAAGQINAASVNLNPIILAPLGDYGGDTLTQPPLPGSPAIDAGISQLDISDQRGFEITDGSPDIGAVELQNNEGPSLFTALWDTDLDGDGTSYGVEYMIGSDPNRSDPEAIQKLTFPDIVFGGAASLVFGRTSNPIPDGATLSLHRSTTLLPNSFIEVAHYEASNEDTSTPDDFNDDFIFLPVSDAFSYLDFNPPSPKAFYRLESEYLPPLQ